MQVTQTHAEGLKREFEIVLPAEDLSTRMESQLGDLQAKAQIKGFRPGKVPVAHLKRLYGRSIMADVLQQAVGEARTKMIEDNKLRVAGEPTFDVEGEDKNVLERALEQKGDLKFKVALEVLPKVEVGTLDDIELEKLVSDVPDAEVDRILTLLANQNRSFEPKGAGAVAEKGDKVTVDFVGKIDDETFEGGAGEDVDLVLGSGSFIPGFEDQIVGMAVGEQRTVAVTFPADYAAAALAGKPANFGVSLKAIAAPGDLPIDDAFAKTLGLDDLAKLKESVRGNIERDYAMASRAKWKRALLDTLDKRYDFPLPEGLVEQEFNAIWRQVEAEQKSSGKSFADENTTEDAARADYRKIAERRVRLGLVLAEIGEAAGVKVTQDEMNAALMERVRQYPGDEKQVWEFFRNNPQAMAQIQAPIFEDKVLDHVVTQAKVTERKVPLAELTAPDEEDRETAAA
jgi:trigger factor